jgi:hypothetical protein
LSNRDLAYGYLIGEIYDTVGEPCKYHNRYPIMSDILFNFVNSKSPKWWWPAVYQKRHAALKLANQPAKSIDISQTDKDRIVQAIQFWNALIKQLVMKKVSAITAEIRTSGGFFGYVLCDQLSKTTALSDNQEVNCKRIIDHSIDRYCPTLCRGNKAMIIHTVQTIDKILKGKVGNKQNMEEIDLSDLEEEISPKPKKPKKAKVS